MARAKAGRATVEPVCILVLVLVAPVLVHDRALLPIVIVVAVVVVVVVAVVVTVQLVVLAVVVADSEREARADTGRRCRAAPLHARTTPPA